MHNPLRLIALLALRLNHKASHGLVNLYERLGLFRRIYAACDFSEDMIHRLATAQLKMIREGVDAQQEILVRFAEGKMTIGQLRQELLNWYTDSITRGTKILEHEFVVCPTA
jgi:hypothetical protein